MPHPNCPRWRTARAVLRTALAAIAATAAREAHAEVSGTYTALIPAQQSWRPLRESVYPSLGRKS
jgi:hypothetical protein